MLPFMKTGALIKNRSPDIQEEEPHQEDKELHELEEVVKDFMQAMNAKDVSRMASIIRMAHDILHDYMDVSNRAEEEEQD